MVYGYNGVRPRRPPFSPESRRYTHKCTIAFLPLLWVAPVAMDVSRVLVVKQRFTNAVAAAALAVGRQLGRDDADMPALAQGFSNAHNTAADMGAPTNLTLANTAMQVDTTVP